MKRMRSMLDTTITNNAEIDEIVKAILNAVPALEIYLFGSYVKGIATEDSDYDFYVVIPDDSIRAIEATWKITSSIPKQTRGIDMLVGTLSKFNKYKNVCSIEKEVSETGVRLYG